MQFNFLIFLTQLKCYAPLWHVLNKQKERHIHAHTVRKKAGKCIRKIKRRDGRRYVHKLIIISISNMCLCPCHPMHKSVSAKKKKIETLMTDVKSVMSHQVVILAVSMELVIRNRSNAHTIYWASGACICTSTLRLYHIMHKMCTFNLWLCPTVLSPSSTLPNSSCQAHNTQHSKHPTIIQNLTCFSVPQLDNNVTIV